MNGVRLCCLWLVTQTAPLHCAHALVICVSREHISSTCNDVMQSTHAKSEIAKCEPTPIHLSFPTLHCAAMCMRERACGICMFVCVRNSGAVGDLCNLLSMCVDAGQG